MDTNKDSGPHVITDGAGAHLLPDMAHDGAVKGLSWVSRAEAKVFGSLHEAQEFIAKHLKPEKESYVIKAAPPIMAIKTTDPATVDPLKPGAYPGAKDSVGLFSHEPLRTEDKSET